MSETVEREVGRARYRKEDAHLITGQTNWTDNISVTGLLHIAILRSPMAHARIDRVDVSAALERPGVIAAFSGRDVAQEMGSLPCAWPVAEDTVVPDHPPVAVDEVRYAGDPVAVVVARDRYTAADALEAIEVDYTPLPAALDIEGALTDGAPLVHSDKGTNRCYDYRTADGDYAATKAKADIVLTRRYHQQRLIPTAMEPRAVVVTRSPRPATSPSTPPPRSRTSCASCSPSPPVSRRTRSASSPPTSAADSAPSSRCTARK